MHFQVVRPLGTMTTSLASDQEVPSWITGFTVEVFSSGDLFCYVWTGFFLCCNVLCTCSVLCCLRESSLHPAYHRSVEAVQMLNYWLCRGIFLKWRIVPCYVWTELFLCFNAFCPCSVLCCVVFGGVPCTLLITSQGRLSKCVSVPICDP